MYTDLTFQSSLLLVFCVILNYNLGIIVLEALMECNNNKKSYNQLSYNHT